MTRLLVAANRVFDGTRETLRHDAAVVVDDGRITEVLDSAPDDGSFDQRLDLGDMTLLPGLVDSHDHLAIDMGNGKEEAQAPLHWRALKAVHNLDKMLRSGITTLRCPGETGDLAYTMRKGLDEGLIHGPRLVVAGQTITATGGHGWFIGIEADGPDAVRAAVRTQVKEGADFIKTIITGGATTSGSNLSGGCMTEAEIDAAIDEAHRQGKRITAHAYGGEIASHAIRSGIDCIEHGTFLTDDDLDEMARRGTYLVSTAGVMRAASDPTLVRPFMARQFAKVAEAYVETLGRVRERGIKVVVGNDTHHAHLDHELEILCMSGYTPAEALIAATARGAELCQLEDEIGTIEPGKWADFIAAPGNPLEDIAAIRNVELVMQKGNVVIDDRG